MSTSLRRCVAYALKPPAARTLLCGLAGSLLLPVHAETAADGDAPARLADVVVSAEGQQPLPASLASAPAVVESRTAEQLRESTNLVTSAQALKYLPSIEVRERFIGDRNGILATRTTGTISSAQSLVYADDLLLSNLLGNSYAFPPRWGLVTPAEIARVDVLYGPFSALYPGNSLGGVVTLETRMPTRPEFHASVTGSRQDFDLYGSHDDYGTGNISLAGGNRRGPLSVWVSYDHLDSQGQPMSYATAGLSSKAPVAGAPTASGAHADSDQNGKQRLVFGGYSIDHSLQDQGKLKLGWDLNDDITAVYTLGLWSNDSHTGADSYLKDASGRTLYNGTVNIDGHSYKVSGLNPSRTDELHLLNGLSFASHSGGLFDWQASASDYRYLDSSTRTASNYGQSQAGTRQVQDGTGWQTGELRGIWRPDSHEVSFGYHIDDYLLKQRTYQLDDWKSGGNGAKVAASGGETRTQALYLQDAWRFAPRWTLTLGARAEHWEAFDGFNRDATTTPQQVHYDDQQRNDISPKAALTFDITDALQTRFSYGRAVRYPTVGELFQQISSGTQLVQNNPDLKPEDVRSFDWTTQYGWDRYLLRVSLFQEERHDALFSQTDTSVSPNVTRIDNIDRARLRGIESALDAKDVGLPGLDLSASLTWTQARILEDALTPAAEGNDYPRIPRWRARLSAVYHQDARLTYALGYRYASASYGTLLNTDDNHDTYGGISRYSVFDVKASYRIDEHLTASAGIDNLGNEKYYVSHPYPQRTAFLGLSYDY